MGIGFVSAKAQNNLTGRVIDQQSNDAIQNAEIQIVNTSVYVTTNSNGEFTLSFPDKGIIVLKTTHISYISSFDTINGSENYASVTIVMNPNSRFLNEIEITDSFEHNAPYIINTIPSRVIKETSVFDVGTLLKREPNVGGIKKGALGVDPVIRGFKYSQVSVLIDGYTRIEGGCPNRMDPTASHVNISDISNIEILKGPFALKYGPNFGGMVNIKKHNPVFNANYKNNVSMIIGGQTNHEGYKSGIRTYGGNSKVAYTLSANKSSYRDYKSGDGEVISAGSNNYNYDVGVGFKPSENQILSVNFDRSYGRNVDFAALPMDERTDDTKVYQLNWFLSPKTKSLKWIKVNAYHSDVAHVMDNKNRAFSDTVVAVSDIHATNTGGRFSMGSNICGGLLETGLSYEHIYKDGQRTKWMIVQPNLPSYDENLWNNAFIDNAGFFAEYRKNSGNLDLIVAGRFDYNQATSDSLTRYKMNGSVVFFDDDTESNYLNFSFSAGLTWHLSQKNSLFLSVGSGTRSPDMTERFIVLLPVGYDSYDYLGNPQLKPETNHELDLGYIHDCDLSGRFEASVFFSYVTDYISSIIVPPSEVMPQTRGVLGVKQFENIDEAYLTGMELSYQNPAQNKLNVRLTASYTTGINPEAIVYKYENGQFVDEQIVKNDPLPEIPPMEANIWLGYDFFQNKLMPEIHFRAVAAQNQISEAYGEQKTPEFFVTDVRLLYKYNSYMWFSTGINNIFDNNYYEHLNRRIIGSKTPFYEPGRLFYANIIVNL